MKKLQLWMTVCLCLSISPLLKAQTGGNTVADSTPVHIPLPEPAQQNPVRVMFVGNSITKGGGLDGGFRREIYHKFLESKIWVDFVGRFQDGNFPDAEHEGISGQRADEVLANINTILATNPPDIVVLHIGTNDINQNQSPSATVDEVSSILDEIIRFGQDQQRIIPTVLAKIVAREPGTSRAQATQTYNMLLEEMANRRIQAGDPIHLVDLETLLNHPDDYYDELHPNCLGHQKMATPLYQGIQEVISTYYQAETAAASTNGSAIEGFSLIDAQSNTEIRSLQDGDVVVLNKLSTDLLSLRANSNSALVGSVALHLRGPIESYISHNQAPFAAFKLKAGGDYEGKNFPPGKYKLTAFAYEEAELGGQLLQSTDIVFDVVEQLDLYVQSFSLVNAETNEVIQTLKDGDVISLEGGENTPLTILTNTAPYRVGSVRLELDGPSPQTRLETAPPYSLFGEVSGQDYRGQIWQAGTYTMQAIPYINTCESSVAGASLELSFTLNFKGDEGDEETEPQPPVADTLPVVEAVVLIDAASDEEIRVLQPQDTIYLSEFAELTLLAKTARSQSVRFTLKNGDGQWLFNKYENMPPFAFFGDDPGPDYKPWNPLPAPGDYHIEVQSFGERFAGGAKSTQIDIQLHIGQEAPVVETPVEEEEEPIEETEPQPPVADTLPVVEAVVLIDAASDEEIRVLQPQDTIYLSEFAELTLLAKTARSQSVRFTLKNGDGQWLFNKYENMPPFAFFGDDPGPDYKPWSPLPAPGDYHIEVQSFGERFAAGAKSTQIDIQLHIGQEAPVVETPVEEEEEPVEETEPQPPVADTLPVVEAVVLIDAASDEEIRVLQPQDTIYLNEFPELTLLAKTAHSESVRFTFKTGADKWIFNKYDNFYPFAFFGDDPGPDYKPWSPLPAPGDYLLEVASYGARFALGDTSQQVNFQLHIVQEAPAEAPVEEEEAPVEETEPQPPVADTLPVVEAVVLIDAASDEEIRVLQPQDTIYLSEFAELTLLAKTARSQSVRFTLKNGDGQWLFNKYENMPPFAFFGDDPGPDYKPWSPLPAPGDYHIEVQSFGERFAKGAKSIQIDIQLHIVGNTETAARISTSEIIEVSEIDMLEEAQVLKVFPNPGDAMYVDFSSPIIGQLKIYLMDERGEIAWKQLLEFEDEQARLYLDWQKLSLKGGFYYLILEGDLLDKSVHRIEIR